MPVCRLCLKVQPTVEVRRTRLGHVCKDKWTCNNRQVDIQQRAERSGPYRVRAALPYDAHEAYDLSDPKHPDYAGIASDFADMQRKRDKGE